jgi:hypothetical protein
MALMLEMNFCFYRRIERKLTTDIIINRVSPIPCHLVDFRSNQNWDKRELQAWRDRCLFGRSGVRWREWAVGTFCFVIVSSTCAAQSVLFHCVRTRNAVDGAGLAHSIISSSFRGSSFKGILVQLSRTLPFKILPGIVVLQQSLLDYFLVWHNNTKTLHRIKRLDELCSSQECLSTKFKSNRKKKHQPSHFSPCRNRP